ETQCQDDGRWDPPVPVCERMLRCAYPPAIANGKPSSQDMAVFTSGMSVNYSCEPGYSLTGQASIYCTPSGTWSPAPPWCAGVLCITPEIQNGRKVDGRGPFYRPKDTVRFECDPGYTLNGSRQIRYDGRWDPPVPVCERSFDVLRCVSPPAIANGKPSSQDLAVFTSGMSVNYSCEPGYSLTGQASIYCTASGTWSPAPPRCAVSEVLCIAPEIENGRKVDGPFPSGTYVNYSCEPGYALHGEASVYCTTSGTWSHPSPLCEGERIFGGCGVPTRHFYSYKDNVTFECDPGYTMKGHSLSQCQTDDTWDPPLPVCEPGKCQNSDLFPGFCLFFGWWMFVNYHCDLDYSLLEEASFHCTVSGACSLNVKVCFSSICCFPLPRSVRQTCKRI
uniref:Sushi domain-containing protein n=1 Tax=Chelydra serpentina TaxID=8475 RepID=A0A8C3RIH8_CHESE